MMITSNANHNLEFVQMQVEYYKDKSVELLFCNENYNAVPIVIAWWCKFILSDLVNQGKVCISECNEMGPCPYCGREGLCCRIGYIGDGCDGKVGGQNGYECVSRPGRLLIFQNLLKWIIFD